jgi:NhaP-type Na+/H+ or K+/H+ antiporter
MMTASRAKRRVTAGIWVFLAIAAAALAALKVYGQVAWPWWMVTAPLWIVPAALAAVLALTALLCAVRPVTVAPVRWLIRRLGRR